MAELVFFWSVRKITHSEWLLNGPIFYCIGPDQYVFFFFCSGPVSFGGKILPSVFDPIKHVQRVFLNDFKNETLNMLIHKTKFEN